MNTTASAMNSPAPKFSIIVPAYNEELLLPRLLASIQTARESYSGGAAAIEVIVADNNSSDGTAAVAESLGVKVVKVSQRCIAAARNGGARVAQGEILCFIDADSEIHPNTFDAIEKTFNRGKYVAGSTGLRPEKKSVGVFVTFLLMQPVIWITRIDAGVISCKREDFEAVGGYDETRLYGEDVMFLLAMRTLGRSRGQRLGRVKGVKALGSARKFDQFGDWHYFGFPIQALKSLVTGNWNDEKLAQRYWYNSGR
jgi:glycosyltransferase involved in cell wall biosynthesis